MSSLKEQLRESNDKYLRLYADFENYKRRLIKEKEDLVIYTKSKAIESLLNMDNDMDFALKNTTNNETYEGISLIHKKLKKELSDNGVVEIQTDIYDSDIHEVVSIVNNNYGIVDVISKGYMIGDRIIRYPKIILGNA